MGVGNQGGGGNSGNKRSNHNYEHRNLQLLGAVAAAAAGGATEGTALAILNAIIASDQDIEILLVRDTGNSDEVVQQIVDYQTGTPVYSYKDVDGNVYVPVGPLEYLDPSAVLNLMLTEILAQGITLDSLETLLTTIDGVLDAIKLDTANLDVALSTRATEATLLSTNVLLTAIDTVLDTIKTDTGLMVTDLAAIEVLITTTNSLLTTIDTVLDAIKLDTADIKTATEAIETLLTGVSRTPSIATDLGSGTTTAGVKGVSLWFRGGADGTLGTPAVTVPNGSRWTFRADDNDDTVAGIAYAAPTGGNVFITYLT